MREYAYSLSTYLVHVFHKKLKFLGLSFLSRLKTSSRRLEGVSSRLEKGSSRLEPWNFARYDITSLSVNWNFHSSRLDHVPVDWKEFSSRLELLWNEEPFSSRLKLLEAKRILKSQSTGTSFQSTGMPNGQKNWRDKRLYLEHLLLPSASNSKTLCLGIKEVSEFISNTTTTLITHWLSWIHLSIELSLSYSFFYFLFCFQVYSSDHLRIIIVQNLVYTLHFL